MGTQNTKQSPPIGYQKNKTSTQIGQAQGIAPTVGNVLEVFKSLTFNEYIRGVRNNGWLRFNKRLWQRNYYEHIIRDEKSYYQIS